MEKSLLRAPIFQGHSVSCRPATFCTCLCRRDGSSLIVFELLIMRAEPSFSKISPRAFSSRENELKYYTKRQIYVFFCWIYLWCFPKFSSFEPSGLYYSSRAWLVPSLLCCGCYILLSRQSGARWYVCLKFLTFRGILYSIKTLIDRMPFQIL